jgi:hypothetical protein
MGTLSKLARKRSLRSLRTRIGKGRPVDKVPPATEQTHFIIGIGWCGGTMFGTETKIPIVMCPGCDQPTKAIERKPVGFSNGLVDVTYVCETCVTHTIRTIRPEDKGLI